MIAKSVRNRIVLLMMPVLVLGLAACGNEDENPEPTDVPSLEVTEIVQLPSDTPTLSVTLTPSPTVPATATSAPPTATVPPVPSAIPTETAGPYVHRVSEGQTCSELAAYYDTGVAAIRELNNLDARCSLSVGAEILVPRPTATATPLGFGETATAIYEGLPPGYRNVTPYAIYTYCPEAGDTLQSIALKHDTTNRRICELNAGPDGLDCRGCDFSESSVGYCPNPPVVSEFSCYNVPGPTHTVTFTPTFTGSETPTATPTHLPPRAVAPAYGEVVQGRVRLVWVGFRSLEPDETYVVVAIDELTGDQLFEQTRNTSLMIPDIWQPVAGQTRQMLWSVQVVRLTPDGVLMPVSERSPDQRFTWEGR